MLAWYLKKDFNPIGDAVVLNFIIDEQNVTSVDVYIICIYTYA